MNHKRCKTVRSEEKHEPQGGTYFKIIRYWYCEHGELVEHRFIDHYVEGNIAGAYKEHWGKHG